MKKEKDAVKGVPIAYKCTGDTIRLWIIAPIGLILNVVGLSTGLLSFDSNEIWLTLLCIVGAGLLPIYLLAVAITTPDVVISFDEEYLYIYHWFKWKQIPVGTLKKCVYNVDALSGVPLKSGWLVITTTERRYYLGSIANIAEVYSRLQSLVTE